MVDFGFRSKAERKEREVEYRYRLKSEKTYEKYKFKEEQEKYQKAKRIARDDKDEDEDEHGDIFGVCTVVDSAQKHKDDESEGSSCSAGVKEGILKILYKAFRGKTTERKFELKWKEFMSITFCLQVPLTYMMNHATITLRWGALLVLLVYILIDVIIAMPIYMVLMFLGNYSRKSYMRFWECVPIMKGISYSVAITSLTLQIFNMTCSGLCLLYFYDLLIHTDVPWTDCNYNRRDPMCVPVYVQSRYDEKCCSLKYDANCTEDDLSDVWFRYSSWDYFMSNKLKLGYGKTPLEEGIVWPWAIAVGVEWFLIYVMTVIGLRKFRGIMTTINLFIVVAILIPVIFLSVFLTPNYRVIPELASDFQNIYNYKFWIETSAHSLHREMAGDVITFSALSSPGISTTVDTVCIYTLKIFFLVFFTVWISIGVTKLEMNYGVVNPNCVKKDEFMVIFSLFPDLLSRLPMAKLWLLMYFGMFAFWSFSSTLYVVSSCVSALVDDWQALFKRRVLISGFICLACFCANVWVLTPDLLDRYSSWVSDNYIIIKVVLLFFTLLGMYLYSIENIATDYHFTYRERLNEFWLLGFKFAILLVTIIMVLVFLFAYHIKLTNVMVAGLMLSPIFIGAIFATLKYKGGFISTLLIPDPKWGPPSHKKKMARLYFDPKYELKYRMDGSKCKHGCLLQSSRLKYEIKYWRNKRVALHNVDVE